MDKIKEMSDSLTRAFRVRNDTIRTLKAAGWSYRRIAKLYGISPTRVVQIVRGGKGGADAANTRTTRRNSSTP